jgi:hypothetical protein
MTLKRCTKICRQIPVLVKMGRRQRTELTRTRMSAGISTVTGQLFSGVKYLPIETYKEKPTDCIEGIFIKQIPFVTVLSTNLHWCSPLSRSFTRRNNEGKWQTIFFKQNKDPVLGTLFSMSCDFLDDQTNEVNDLEMFSYASTVFQNLYNGQ